VLDDVEGHQESVERARQERYVLAMAGQHVGYCYVTDGGPLNPWGRLPSYWEAELEAVLATRPDTVVLACGSAMIPPDWLPLQLRQTGLVPDLRTAMAGLAYISLACALTVLVADLWFRRRRNQSGSRAPSGL